ncbi:MAG: hypothetical protein BGN96_04605 [Bacteroidales bacterium 45-6]|nr:MAG: hypothetical protein BGN96_04605 [Bacteroidales bacterium 45-6]
MEARMREMAQILVGNGFGFGKYWSGYIFGKNPKDKHFLYLSDSKMAILSAAVEEDGEKTILEAADSFPEEYLNSYFKVCYDKKSAIEWIGKEVNILLCCGDEEKVRHNIMYYMWPAVKLNFVKELCGNTIVVYDRFFPNSILDDLRIQAQELGMASSVEFWSMLKMLTLGDRFGELAPKVCMEMIVEKDGKKKTA